MAMKSLVSIPVAEKAFTFRVIDVEPKLKDNVPVEKDGVPVWVLTTKAKDSEGNTAYAQVSVPAESEPKEGNVEFVGLKASYYSITSNGRTNSGLSFSADSIAGKASSSPAASPSPAAASA